MTDRPPRVAQFHHRSHSRKTLCNLDCVVRERLDASVLRTLFRLRVLATCYKHAQYLVCCGLYSPRVAGRRDGHKVCKVHKPGESCPLHCHPSSAHRPLGEWLLMLMVSWDIC